jgi:hypothetical protein
MGNVHFDREKQQFVGIDELMKKHLINSYPGIDIEKEFGKMSVWLNTPKGKTRKGNISFIMNWLGNAEPTRPTKEVEIDKHLEPLRENYCKELWKNREHILAFNTKKS